MTPPGPPDMDATTTPHNPVNTPAAAAPVVPMLRAVLVCDIVDSTALVERLGDLRAVLLMQRHDQLLRQALQQSGGQLIDRADGVLALFERPIGALDFALRYQRALRELGEGEGTALQARIGIHVGDVMMWANEPRDVLAGAKPFEVEGLAKPVAARLMGLALPGQILMSGMAQNLAQRAAAELGERAARLRWLVHGRYRFKGVPAPMIVHEVGEAGVAPLRAPESGAKAWRELPLWRRPPVLAVEMLVLGVLASFGLWSAFRAPPAIAFAERDWVVVADLDNRTGETVFDESLDVALRVGLEQSRHVNLVSDLQVDSVLRRMQREGEPLDRGLASELALREGAKAVIVPTVAMAGGRVRVSLEVVDPGSGETVYSASGDARRPDGVLPALDQAIASVRGQLGEAMGSIAATSKPLELATTDNLEALRAFSLGVKARMEGRWDDAWDLFEQATRLDPEFSMAYLRMAFLRYSANDGEGMDKYLALAVQHRDHLSEREALFLDASAAVNEGPEPTLRKMRLLSAMYPDEFRAHYNYAYFAWTGAFRYRDALEQIAPAVHAQNPMRASAAYLQGTLHLALGETEAARQAFTRSETLGGAGERRAYAEAYATDRRYDDARRVLQLYRPVGVDTVSFEQRLPDISFAVDQGRWSEALAEARRQAEDAPAVSPLNAWVAQGVLLTLRRYDPDPAFGADLRRWFESQREALAGASRFERRHLVFHVLLAGWMAATVGDEAMAREALAAVQGMPERDAFPANADLAEVLLAELDLQAGEAAAAVARLRERAAAPEALFLLSATHLRALSASGDHAAALAAADALQARRGLAYVEFNSLSVLQPANLVEANLALRAAALHARAAGREDLAAKREAAFEAAWPGHEGLAFVARRGR